MKSDKETVEDYLEELPNERKEIIEKLRKLIKKNLPKGFKEMMNYGMIGYVVPHTTYPAGYHCDPKLPLPFLNVASQKNNIAIYHLGIYADKPVLDWFTNEHKKASKKKLDMGKSCIRYKKDEDIPYELLGELFKKYSVADWIQLYETVIKK